MSSGTVGDVTDATRLTWALDALANTTTDGQAQATIALAAAQNTANLIAVLNGAIGDANPLNLSMAEEEGLVTQVRLALGLVKLPTR